MNEREIKALLAQRLATPAEPPATAWPEPQHHSYYSTIEALGVAPGAVAHEDLSQRRRSSLLHIAADGRGPGSGSGDWLEARVETPVRAPDPAGDVLVPLLQALISGALAAILTAVVMRGKGAGSWLAAGLVVAAIAWLLLLLDHRRLLRTVETWTRQDLDRDGVIGPPQAQETLRVEVVEDKDGGGKGWTLAELPVRREKLTEIARGVQRGTLRLSRRDLASLPGIGSDKARQILAELESAGFLAYPKGRNHPDGAQLTARGRALMRGLLE